MLFKVPINPPATTGFLLFCVEYTSTLYYVKSACIQSFCGPYFPVFRLNTEKYGVISPYSSQIRRSMGQKNSGYGHFLRRACSHDFIDLL